MAWPWALGPLGGPVRIGRSVRPNQADYLYGGSVGSGPWAHGMALGPGPLRGPSKDGKAMLGCTCLESVLESLAYFRSQRAGVVAPMVAFEDLSWLKWV